MGTVSIDDERTEALVALQGFPKEHNHLGRPCQRLGASWKIRGVGLKLLHISDNVERGGDVDIQVDLVFVSYHRPGTESLVAGVGDQGNGERSSSVRAHCQVQVQGTG